MTLGANRPTGDGNEFTNLLRLYFNGCGKKQSAVAGDADVDVGYVSKLLNGYREHPSRNVLIRLAVWGLGLSLGETDELLQAAEKAPLSTLT